MARQSLTVLVALTLANCSRSGTTSGRTTLPTAPNPASVPHTERDALLEAQRAYNQGNLDTAEQRFREVLKRSESQASRAYIYYSLGRIALDRNGNQRAIDEFEQAALELDKVAERDSTHELEQDVRLYWGVALVKSGKAKAGLAQLNALIGTQLEPSRKAVLWWGVLRANDELARGAPALEAVDQLDAAAPDAEGEERARYRERALGRLNAVELDAALNRLAPERATWWHTLKHALARARSTANTERFSALGKLAHARAKAGPNDIVDEVLRAISEHAADIRHIGVLVPLTGRASEVGKRVVDALTLARDEQVLASGGGGAAPVAVDLVIRDTQSRPDLVAALVDDLVEQQKVVAIIGPLEREATRDAARRANELGVPLLSLNPATADANTDGPWVFQQFYSITQESDEIAGYAADHGLLDQVIIYPETPAGTALRDSFADALRRRNGRVIQALGYADGTKSFVPLAQQLARSRFDALYFAGSSTTLALLAPALAAAGIWIRPYGTAAPPKARSIALLAPFSAFDPRLPELAGRYLQGAVFSVPFSAQTADERGQRFVDAFTQRFNRPPEIFAAYAYDGLHVLRAALGRGVQDRASLRAALLSVRDLPTVTPAGGFRSDRKPSRATHLVVLDGGAFTSLHADQAY